MQLNKLNPAIAASLERYTSGDSGYLSGSCSRFDDAGMLEVKDSLGQVSVVVICLPGTLVVSSQPPSGCVLPSRLRALERSGYEAVAGTWTMPLTGRVPGCVLLSPGAQGVPSLSRALDHELPFASRAIQPLQGELATYALADEDLILSALNPPWYEPRPHAAADTEKPRQVAAPVSYQQMIVDIQETFGLHTTDLADLLQVTRQSVHSWKNINGSTPGKLSITKLSRLREAVAQWRDAFPSNAPGWLLHSILEGQTLKSWLILVANGSVTIPEFMQTVSKTLQATARFSAHPAAARAPTAFESFVDTLTSSEPSGDGT